MSYLSMALRVLPRRSLQKTATPFVTRRLWLPSACRYNSSAAPATTINNNQPPLDITDKDIDLTEDVDEWLSAIQQLRGEFSNNGKTFNPETSLAPPGENNVYIELMEQTQSKPTAAQIAEATTLRAKEVPKKNDELLEHCVNLMMRHGKKARAEKFMARALYLMKLKLRIDPVVAFKDILERMSPLMIVKNFKNGTAKSTNIPVPLGRRQRLRIAFGWILTRASERPAKDFSVRLGEELIAAYNGDSKGFEYRAEMHKDAIQYRSYIKL
ncbi:mitochondrial 37S ribosomal protein [Saccharomycopsis crataegensis]|uniref:Mitochondrial 37S ribosomal protein n=1 Tax=Saccharomycopsis crataegensis TaxID=43959 RepID=A0AAV5QRP2_9ASCO|nr:mitochondrial 37S ribosomal protein [Saccharomycopsis crataegensis]